MNKKEVTFIVGAVVIFIVLATIIFSGVLCPKFLSSEPDIIVPSDGTVENMAEERGGVLIIHPGDFENHDNYREGMGSPIAKEVSLEEFLAVVDLLRGTENDGDIILYKTYEIFPGRKFQETFRVPAPGGVIIECQTGHPIQVPNFYKFKEEKREERTIVFEKNMGDAYITAFGTILIFTLLYGVIAFFVYVSIDIHYY